MSSGRESTWGGQGWGSRAEPREGLGRSGEPPGPAVLVPEGLAEEASWKRSAGDGAQVCAASGQSSGSTVNVQHIVRLVHGLQQVQMCRNCPRQRSCCCLDVC